MMLIAPDILQKRLGSAIYTFERMPTDEVQQDIAAFCSNHSLNLSDVLAQYERSHIRSLTYDEWERLLPPLSFWHASCPFSDHTTIVDAASAAIGKDCTQLLSIVHGSGNIIHSPIVMRLSNGFNYVVSGNTRLMLCSIVGAWPKVIMLDGTT